MPGRYRLSQRQKIVRLDGGGNKTTTSASKTPIDSTNLPFTYLLGEVGDLIRCTLVAQAYNSSTGGCGFDFEVDQPASANVYIGNNNEYGLTVHQANTRIPVLVQGIFVVTETGLHGFRPTWGPVSTGTHTLCNATSGADDTLILFLVENIGPVDPN